MVAAGTVGRGLSQSQTAGQKQTFKDIRRLLKDADLSDELREELLQACIAGLDRGTAGVDRLLTKYGMSEVTPTLEFFMPAFNTYYKELSDGRKTKTQFALNCSNSVAEEVCQRWNRSVAKSHPGGLLERVAEPNCCDWCAERNGAIMSAAKYDGVFGHNGCKCYVIPLED